MAIAQTNILQFMLHLVVIATRITVTEKICALVRRPKFAGILESLQGNFHPQETCE